MTLAYQQPKAIVDYSKPQGGDRSIADADN
jgi:hypothetical protein